MRYPFLFALAIFYTALSVKKGQAQSISEERLPQVGYALSTNVTASTHQSPLWLNANRHGLSSVSGSNGYFRTKIASLRSADSTKKWHFAYAADLALTEGGTSSLVLQQLYAEMTYRSFRLSIGSKERAMEMKHSQLSSGSQTFGINARPVPQIRIEIPDYVPLFRRHQWVSVKGHFSYGLLSDGRFQERYTKASERYAKKVWYHSKAGYVKVGNEAAFPFILEGGLEMASLFGGTIYNYNADMRTISLPSSIKEFVKTVYGGGSDPTDGNYKNVGGNVLGSLLLSLKYAGRGWSLRAYLDHFFEDHSMLLLQYGWKDGLYGIEFTPPSNPYVDAFVYEYIKTTDQSGPIFHNRTPHLPYQISALDNYYNHGLYAGWQHWGQAIGNPLYLSPLYEKKGRLQFANNRFVGHHLGLSGKPSSQWAYRLLFSHIKSWGSYEAPHDNPRCQNSFLGEISCRSANKTGLTSGTAITLSFGFDQGTLYGNSLGVGLTLKKTGILF